MLDFVKNYSISKFLRGKCNPKKMENFTDYIKFLKILQNTRTKNVNLLTIFRTFFTFIRKPSLFNNLTELFAIDELHTSLFQSYKVYLKDEKVTDTQRRVSK